MSWLLFITNFCSSCLFQTGTHVSQVFCKALNVKLNLRAINFIQNAAEVLEQARLQLITSIIMSVYEERLALRLVSCVDLNKKWILAT